MEKLTQIVDNELGVGKIKKRLSKLVSYPTMTTAIAATIMLSSPSNAEAHGNWHGPERHGNWYRNEHHGFLYPRGLGVFNRLHDGVNFPLKRHKGTKIYFGRDGEHCVSTSSGYRCSSPRLQGKVYGGHRRGHGRYYGGHGKHGKKGKFFVRWKFD